MSSEVKCSLCKHFDPCPHSENDEVYCPPYGFVFDPIILKSFPTIIRNCNRFEIRKEEKI